MEARTLAATFAEASVGLRVAWGCNGAHFTEVLRDHEDGPALIESLEIAGQWLDEALSHAQSSLDACAQPSLRGPRAASSQAHLLRPTAKFAAKSDAKSGKRALEPRLADQAPAGRRARTDPAPSEGADPGQSDDDEHDDAPPDPPGHWNAEDDPEATSKRFNRETAEFFASLPDGAYTEEEEELRQALLQVLDRWTQRTPPLLKDVITMKTSQGRRVPSRVGIAKGRLLPKGVSLMAWIEERMGEEIECGSQRRSGHKYQYFHRPGMLSDLPAQRTEWTAKPAPQIDEIGEFLRQWGGRCPLPVLMGRFLSVKKKELDPHFDVILKEGGCASRPQDYDIALRDGGTDGTALEMI